MNQLQNFLLRSSSSDSQNPQKEQSMVDIEDFPCKNYYILNEKYKKLNEKFFSNELIYKKLFKNKSGLILKVKDKEIFYPKISQGNYVMMINAYSPNCVDINLAGKVWCIGIKDYKKGNTKFEEYDDDDVIGGGKEEKVDESIFNEDNNEYKGYTYYYKLYSPEDIINIYDYPYIRGVNNLYFMKANIAKKK